MSDGETNATYYHCISSSDNNCMIYHALIYSYWLRTFLLIHLCKKITFYVTVVPYGTSYLYNFRSLRSVSQWCNKKNDMITISHKMQMAPKPFFHLERLPEKVTLKSLSQIVNSQWCVHERACDSVTRRSKITMILPMEIKHICDIYNFWPRKYILASFKYMSSIF